MLAILLKDFYKADHRRQYPEGTEYVYSNLTARYSREDGVDATVVFGIQYFIKEYLIERFNKDFFERPKEDVLKDYSRRINNALGPNDVGTEHISALHDLGYLPLLIKALPEGTLCPIRVPCLTLVNTLPEFYWVTNFIETILSNVLWHPMTTATTAHRYKKLLTMYAEQTSDSLDAVQWQGHDFSMRGQTSFESAMVSAGAHLTSFSGTDTICGIDFLEKYYGADSDKELVGGSVPATEHSVMCMGMEANEEETYDRLINHVYPKGIVSIVSDTWDYWHVLNVTIRRFKDDIMKRDGKIVIRPDSGCPIKIICGDEEAPEGSLERRGTIDILWEIFGGTINPKGYKELDPHIGCIYGDSITLDRADTICKRLKIAGFASTNIVFGIGSYTYQYVTRDTFGFAMKATWGVVNGEARDIFKKPKTDVGVKSSAKGLLCVNDDLSLSEEVSPFHETLGMLRPVFLNGENVLTTTLSSVRARLSLET